GAILLDLDAEKLLSVFKFSSPESEEAMRRKIPEKAVAINSLRARPATIEECVDAFKAGFEEALAINLTPYILSEEQLAYIKSIEEKKYGNDEWNFRN